MAFEPVASVSCAVFRMVGRVKALRPGNGCLLLSTARGLFTVKAEGDLLAGLVEGQLAELAGNICQDGRGGFVLRAVQAERISGLEVDQAAGIGAELVGTWRGNRRVC